MTVRKQPVTANSPTAGPDAQRRVVAVALLDDQELRNLSTGLRKVFPLPCDKGGFDELLIRIEQATKK